MASTIRVRAIAGAETTEVQALVQHPMDSGFVKDAQGSIIPAHHIETVQFEAGVRQGDGIVGSHPGALGNQVLGQPHGRRTGDRIGVRFEGQAQNSHVLVLYGLNALGNLFDYLIGQAVIHFAGGA